MNHSEVERDVLETVTGPPRGYFVLVPQREGEAVNLAELLGVLRNSWMILLGSVVIAAAIAIVICLSMRNLYRAQALVATVDQSGSGLVSGLRSQLGGLAALAGVDLGSNGGRKEQALATLASPGFARDFIKSRNLMPILFAEKWDPAHGRWREGAPPPKLEDGVKKFTNEVRSITEDKKSGVLVVTVDWYSPELAAQWANEMIDMVNERLRVEASRNAAQSIEYLNNELSKASVLELRQAIYQLIETQVNNAMVANVQHEYAFHFIDAAVPPESRFSPKRTVVTIVAAVVGLFVGLVVVLVRYQFMRSPVSSGPRRMSPRVVKNPTSTVDT